MLVGYMRISKADGSQATDLQLDALVEAGVDPEQVYEDEKPQEPRTIGPGWPLCRLLQDPEQYGRIRTQVLLSLSSKYAISLYEVLTTIINRKKSELRLTLEQLRQILRIPEDKLGKWSHIKMRDLDPAVEELNVRAENSGFKVTYVSDVRGLSFLEFRGGFSCPVINDKR